MNFAKATHTLVVSDLHLSECEPINPKKPLWKKFKRRAYFIDDAFSGFLNALQAEVPEEKELVLNGDIFDFDSVMALPVEPLFSMNWLEKRRGLEAEEQKSCFKISVILKDHPVFLSALRTFLLAGNRVVFIIGNHDLELHWMRVRQVIMTHLDLPVELYAHVRFCEWFYISNGDTLIEHGNQYDDYCTCLSPINPLVTRGERYFVRLPFGNLAGKFMLNGMGLMNPHVDSSFIKSSLWEYLRFFYRYVIWYQPFLLMTWFWSALVTLLYSVREGLLPVLRDPLMVNQRVDEIAFRSNSTPRMVRALNDNGSHPAVLNPIKMLRELWLDRAIFLMFIFFIGYQIFSFLNIFSRFSLLWFIVPVLLLFPAFIFYAKSVESNVSEMKKALYQSVGHSSEITQVKRVILGHTHREDKLMIGDVAVLNSGTWSSAYLDVECEKPDGRKCFVWVRPVANSEAREALLFEWEGPTYKRLH